MTAPQPGTASWADANNFQQPLRTIWQPRSLILPAEGCRLKCYLPVLHDLQYFVKNRPGGFILAHKRELLRPVRGNERDYICVRAKAGTLCAQVIGDRTSVV